MPIDESSFSCLPTVTRLPVWALIERPTRPIRLRLTGSCRSASVGARCAGDRSFSCWRSRWSPPRSATAVALLIPWLPIAAGEEADRIDFVYWFTTVICIVVFAVVAAVLVYSIWKFRAKPGRLLRRAADARPHAARDRLDGDPGRARDRDLDRQRDRARAEQPTPATTRSSSRSSAQQFAWTFTYPNGKTYGYLRLPMDRHAKLDITANDVIHSFWVPRARAEAGRRPGRANNLIVVTPTRTGTFPVICTELCGLGHASCAARSSHGAGRRSTRWLQGRRPGRRGRGAGPRGLPAGGLRRLPHVQAGGRERQGRPDLDNLKELAAKARPGRSRRLHPRVDRRTGRLHRAGLPGRDAAHLRRTDPARSSSTTLVQYLAEKAR